MIPTRFQIPLMTSSLQLVIPDPVSRSVYIKSTAQKFQMDINFNCGGSKIKTKIKSKLLVSQKKQFEIELLPDQKGFEKRINTN